MNRKSAAFVALFFLIFSSAPAHARLGETELQSQTRYGAPKPELLLPDERPLVEGIKDTAYKFEGWRIRVAFINGVAARIEYAHLPENGALKPVTYAEVTAILEAERGTQRWREPKHRPTGDIGKDIGAAIAGAIAGKTWERPDRATATLKPGNFTLLLELPAAVAYEKQRAAKPSVPKF